MIYIRKDPASDSRISHEELTYIRENLEDLSAKKNLKTPWKAIFSSSAVYAVIVASFCDLWSRLTFLTEIPNFLNSMVHNDLGTRGLFAAAPYLLCLLLTIAVSPFLDYLRRTIFSTKVVRKLGTVFGFLVTATFLVIIPNLRDEKATVAWVSAVTLVSYMSNPLDIAPNYAAILTGIAQTISSIPGIISPFLTGVIVQNGSQNEWEIVFYISAGFCIFGAIFFAIFAKGEVQEWAKINLSVATELQETQISYPN
uniref:Putative permease of the major facilitator superfamily protein n=1 Tax=Lutzomyia longipalpis TaxID=7200 RepID=A0A1B0CVT0_LUTLO